MGRREDDSNDLQGASCSTQKRAEKMAENDRKENETYMLFTGRNLERLSPLVTSGIG